MNERKEKSTFSNWMRKVEVIWFYFHNYDNIIFEVLHTILYLSIIDSNQYSQFILPKEIILQSDKRNVTYTSIKTVRRKKNQFSQYNGMYIHCFPQRLKSTFFPLRDQSDDTSKLFHVRLYIQDQYIESLKLLSDYLDNYVLTLLYIVVSLYLCR